MSVTEALEQAVQESVLPQLGKPHYWLLQRACILSSLSLRVYDNTQTDPSLNANSIRLTRLPKPKTPVSDAELHLAEVPEATLLCGPVGGLPVHAIWHVKDLGVVVAFRGTDNLQDVLVDINFPPQQLLSNGISLHGAIHSAAVGCMSTIASAYARAAQLDGSGQDLPLYLTGQLLNICGTE